MRRLQIVFKKLCYGINRTSFLTMFMALALTLNSVAVYAQDGGGGEGGGGDDVFKDTFNDLALIGYMGLGGAILGLSTLSFVDEPSKNLKNIVVGGAIGVIVGVGVVAWKQASKSQESYSYLVTPSQNLALSQMPKSITEWNDEARWAESRASTPLALNWNFDF